MWANAVLIFMTLLTISYMSSRENTDEVLAAARANAVAHNFLSYGRVVSAYADANAAWNGALANVQPVNIANSEHTVTASNVIVWADLDGPTLAEVCRLSKSAAFGTKANGRFLSQEGVAGDILPAVIPDGATVYYRSR